MDNILDENEYNDRIDPNSIEPDLAPGTLRRLLIYMFSLLVINLLFAILKPVHLPDDFPNRENFELKIKVGQVFAIILGSAILGFFFATMFSLIPYKNLSYGKKYLPTSIILIITVQSIILFFFLRDLINSI